MEIEKWGELRALGLHGSEDAGILLAPNVNVNPKGRDPRHPRAPGRALGKPFTQKNSAVRAAPPPKRGPWSFVSTAHSSGLHPSACARGDLRNPRAHTHTGTTGQAGGRVCRWPPRSQPQNIDSVGHIRFLNFAESLCGPSETVESL